MTGIFSQIFNMSLTGSLVILVVMLIRLFLKRSPKIFSYALWSVVLFRLLCPVSLSAPVSVLEVVRPEVQETSDAVSVVSYLPAERNQTSDFSFIPAEGQSESQAVTEEEPKQHSLDLASTACCIWMAGAAVMLLYSTGQYVRLRMKLVGAMAYRGNVYLADYIDSPFVLGFFRPRIYLPSDVPMEERKFIIAHERHHIRRFDHVVKLLAYLALCIHWFNPLVWAAFLLAGKDMEMSCDEAVINQLGSQIRADYSASLLRLATHRKIIAGMPLAFGEGDTKGRVMNMAKWKKPKIWVCIVCVVLCIAVLVICAVNPDNRVQLGVPIQFQNFTFRMPDKEDVYLIWTNDTRIDFFDNGEKFGGVKLYNAPSFALEEDAGEDGVWNGVEWLTALGIPSDKNMRSYVIHNEEESNGYRLYGDIMAAYQTVPEDEPAEVYYCFIDGNDVYVMWFDQRIIELEMIERIMDSAGPDKGLAVGSDAYIQQLPDGYSCTADGNGNATFRDDTNIVGGVAIYPIPDGVYDPSDKYYFWLEELGIPDFEDPSLCYMGGISSWDNGWIAEFESDVPDGEQKTVHRRHIFKVAGDTVYDIWFDMLLIDYETSEALRAAVKLPQVSEPETEATDTSSEELAFEKCLAVMDAVANGSYSIISEQKNEGTQGPSGYARTYCWNDGDFLNTTTLLTEGENTTDAGAYYSRHAWLYAGDRFFSNEGHQGEAGDILWAEADPVDPDSPWLGSRAWVKNFVTYIDTLTDENGECILYRYDKPYDDLEGYSDCYFVNFYFDPEGNFLNVKVQVNLYQDNAFTVTESIVSLDPETVAAEIDREYRRAIG